MNKKTYVILFIFSLTFYYVISLIQKTPGYMDASYYYVTGRLIASGHFYEPFIWNYLNSQTNVNNPVFSYWMPLSGLLAALPMLIGVNQSFNVSRISFILLASLIPVLCLFIASKFSARRFIGWLAAGFGLLGGYYLPYLTITESFAPMFILGAVFFLLCFELTSKDKEENVWLWGFLGIVAGLMHLARADGILWLAGGGLFLIINLTKKETIRKDLIRKIVFLLFGYLLIMAGWYLRNLVIYHSLFPVGSNLTIWMTEYNDLFIYPATKLTRDYWISSGFQSILKVRLDALAVNLRSFIGIVGSIILFPFLLVGLWRLRNNKVIQLAVIMFLGLFLLMSLVFPFAGARGGFFHSASAFQILFWAVAAYGFECSITWIAKIRKWKVDKSIPLLGTTLLVVFAMITSFTYYIKVRGLNYLAWDAEYSNFQDVDQYLKENLEDSQSIVMINDSPGFYAATGRKAIQEAKIEIKELPEMLKEFEAKYIVIGKDHLSDLDILYNNHVNQNSLMFVGQVGENVIYELSD